ncbi:alpha amylase N-terminal ig-like domain-containing protein [Blautia sp. TF12-12AT]|uniref:alpha amylase N-terminal ig-like domain-containing protein n=1 Tax=Blautia sp. TF12-12AT TaxID=2292988 RepID=UPI00242B3D4A|nr:alpha amylase N-terminal ig-like domain-containing protein [Blautia sp. TF12-12AT]
MIDEEIKKAYSKVTKQCETKSDRVSYKDAKNSFRAIREENEMEFSGVYHKTSEQMSYALDEDRLIVNIKTGYDVKQVFIHYGDPYEAGILGGKEKWIGKREEMIYKKTSALSDLVDNNASSGIQKMQILFRAADGKGSLVLF